MRRASILWASILLGLLLGETVGSACGDKLMLVMGSRYSQIRAQHPAAILAYLGQSESATLIRNLQSQPAVRKAGYRLELVRDSAGFDNALRIGKFDVVVADVSEASEVSQKVSAAASKPVLLPLAFKPSKQEQSAALKKYRCLLQAPGSLDNYLDAFDHAMELKLKRASR